jgi:hypothetical protein
MREKQVLATSVRSQMDNRQNSSGRADNELVRDVVKLFDVKQHRARNIADARSGRSLHRRGRRCITDQLEWSQRQLTSCLPKACSRSRCSLHRRDCKWVTDQLKWPQRRSTPRSPKSGSGKQAITASARPQMDNMRKAGTRYIGEAADG